jgi:hypothetical protein
MILVESVFVGLWTTLLYILLKPYWNGVALWFLLGFCKHEFAGILGIHDYYCHLKVGTHATRTSSLLLESIGEGFLFLVAHLFIADHWMSVLVLGCTLHLFFEVIGEHATFIKTRCKK